MSAVTKKEYSYEDSKKVYKKKKKRVIKRKKRNKITLGILKNWFLFLVVFSLGTVIIFNYSMITEKKMYIKKLDNQISELNDKIDEYNIFLESFNSTNKIESIAKNYLGMNYPNRKQIVFVDYDTEEISDKKEKDISKGFIDKIINLFR